MLGLGEGAAQVQGAHIMPTEQVLYSPDSYFRYSTWVHTDSVVGCCQFRDSLIVFSEHLHQRV